MKQVLVLVGLVVGILMLTSVVDHYADGQVTKVQEVKKNDISFETWAKEWFSIREDPTKFLPFCEKHSNTRVIWTAVITRVQVDKDHRIYSIWWEDPANDQYYPRLSTAYFRVQEPSFELGLQPGSLILVAGTLQVDQAGPSLFESKLIKVLHRKIR